VKTEVTDRAEGDAPARVGIAVADQGTALSWETRTQRESKRPPKRWKARPAPPVDVVQEAPEDEPTAEEPPAAEPPVEEALPPPPPPPPPEPAVEVPQTAAPEAAVPVEQPPPPEASAPEEPPQPKDEPTVRRMSWPARTPTQERLHPDGPPAPVVVRRPFPWRWIGVPLAVVAIVLGGVLGAIALKPYLLPEPPAPSGPVLTVAAMRPKPSSRRFEVTVANASNHVVTAECTARAVNPAGTKEVASARFDVGPIQPHSSWPYKGKLAWVGAPRKMAPGVSVGCSVKPAS
jgi:hypothetical protein